MTPVTACNACGHITTTIACHGGLTAFCAACQPGETICEPFQHAWRGTKGNKFACYKCPATLSGEKISTATVPATTLPADVA